MVHYKLQYFDFRGLGEPIKLLFHYVGQEYEFEQFDLDGNWLEYKLKTPYGHLPILLVDGEPIAESRAIGRFLGDKFHLRGNSDIEAARIDSIIDFFLDFYFEVRPYVLLLTGYIKGDKDHLYTNLWLPKTSYALPILSQLLQESKSGFFSKNGLTWVDFFIAELNYTMSGLDLDIYQPYPELLEHYKRVYDLSEVKKYVELRKKSIL